MEEKVIVTKRKLTAIGDNIRSQTNTTKQYTLDEMASMKLGGSDTLDATATSEDILFGKTAYANDIKVVGAIEDYNGEQEGGIDNTQEDGLIEGTLTSYSNSRVTSVGENAFQSNKKLINIDLPNVTNIESYAFQSCTNLKSINVPKVKSLNQCSFSSCEKLEDINMPLLTQLQKDTFYNCKALKMLNFPNVTFISADVFYGCTKLESINIPLVDDMRDNAFYNCSSLTNINIPLIDTVSNNSFYGCKALTNLDFPNARYIGSYAFYGCSNVVKANIPVAISIGASAFYNCYSLKAVIIRQETQVCTLSNTNAFTKCYHILGTTNSTYNPNGDKDGYIYVPDSLVDSYKSATNWSTYASQIKPLSELPQEYNTN